MIAPDSTRLRRWVAGTLANARSLMRGLALTGLIAIAASYLAEHHGGPAMLLALLLGIAFKDIAHAEKAGRAVKVASHGALRLGVALLGTQITWDEIGRLGLPVVSLVVAGVGITIVAGAGIGRAFGLSRDYSVLSAGAVAICGASAALAIASVLPKHAQSEQDAALAVILVTTLSTLAMMLYPLIVILIGMDDEAAGVFLGATIHDVAQVIGAGYTISDDVGTTATIVKLLRVACLAPAAVAIRFACRATGEDGRGSTPLVPAFLVGFAAMVALNSLGAIPTDLRRGLGATSGWLLLSAVAGLGMRTSLMKLAATGPRPILVMTAQTALLALMVIAAHLHGQR